MRPIADDIVSFLVGTGVVGALADPIEGVWGSHVNAEPSGSPHQVVTVYDTGGDGPDTDEQDLFRPTFQVRTRSFPVGNRRDVYGETYAKQEAIREQLIQAPVVQVEGSTIVQVVMTSDILPLGRDDSNRFLLTANYRAIRQRS